MVRYGQVWLGMARYGQVWLGRLGLCVCQTKTPKQRWVQQLVYYNCYLFCFVSDLISEYQQYQEATVDDYDSDDADKSQEDD